MIAVYFVLTRVSVATYLNMEGARTASFDGLLTRSRSTSLSSPLCTVTSHGPEHNPDTCA